ncbi:hypothetical protein BDQ17DRAFT_1333476 [Cyathus striatus]|nr:hypothetical protein BDQ17DRAFT_1333476 [Cyathus striatus]
MARSHPMFIPTSLKFSKQYSQPTLSLIGDIWENVEVLLEAIYKPTRGVHRLTVVKAQKKHTPLKACACFPHKRDIVVTDALLSAHYSSARIRKRRAEVLLRRGPPPIAPLMGRIWMLRVGRGSLLAGKFTIPPGGHGQEVVCNFTSWICSYNVIIPGPPVRVFWIRIHIRRQGKSGFLVRL